MTLNKAIIKSEGLDQLKRYLLTGRKTRSELQDLLGIDRTTLWRWIRSLERNEYAIDTDEQGRLFIDRNTYLTSLKLSAQESVLLMLALRLFQQYNDKPQHAAVEMLHKLGTQLMHGVATVVGPHVIALAEAQRAGLSQQRTDADRRMEAIGTAWLTSRKLRIFYRPLHAHRPFEEVFHPYMLEPSAIGRSTYMIGYSELVDGLRVRKVERLQRTPIVEDDTFEIAKDFDIHRLLSGAWGIWFDADEQPTTVTLRFSTYVVQRVEETRWHPTERKVYDAEGRLVWTAEIDTVEEMLPWIRGWGADCEVIEPAAIRDQIIANVKRMVRLYGTPIGATPTDGLDLDVLGSLFGA
ncbi:MAG: WYL domain-containing protein [Chloroflexaceae bacterium]|nr:WYL domain-containing protein [Chloroflexaceae bacterium]